MFEGDIVEPSTGNYLYAYFLGNKDPGDLSPGDTECLIKISDQTSELPFLAYGPSMTKYTTPDQTYICILNHQCGVVAAQFLQGIEGEVILEQRRLRETRPPKPAPIAFSVVPQPLAVVAMPISFRDKERRPEITIIAGPNGAGKSRLCPLDVSTASFDGDKLKLNLHREHPDWPDRWVSGTVASELEKQKNLPRLFWSLL